MTCCIAKLLVFVLSMKQGIIGKCQFYQKSLFIRCRYQVSVDIFIDQQFEMGSISILKYLLLKSGLLTKKLTINIEH